MPDIDLILKAIAALGAAAAAFWAWRAKQVGKGNHEAIQQIQIQIDGRLEELLELTRVSARAAGALDERIAQADRVALPPTTPPADAGIHSEGA